LSLDITMLTSL